MPGLYFEEFHVGQEFHHAFSRTVTEMDNTMFSLMTMNPQPLHIDAHFSENTEFGQRLFNSMYTLGIMIGMTVYDTTLGTTIGNLGMTDVRFPKPVFHGDTLKAHTKIISVRAEQVAPHSGHRRVRAHRHQPARRGGGDLPPPGPDALQAEGLITCVPFCSFPATAPANSKAPARRRPTCLILDLEDSVAPDQKAGARGIVREMLKAARRTAEALHPRQRTRHRPDACRPRRRGAGQAGRHHPAEMRGRRRHRQAVALSRCVRDRATASRPDTSASFRSRPRRRWRVLKLDTFAGCSKRLWGLTWGGEDLSGGARRHAQPHRRQVPQPLSAGARSVPDQRGGGRRGADRHDLRRYRQPRRPEGRSHRRPARRFPRQDGDPSKTRRRRQRRVHAVGRGEVRTRKKIVEAFAAEPDRRRGAGRRQDGRQAAPARSAEGAGAGVARHSGRAQR